MSHKLINNLVIRFMNKALPFSAQGMHANKPAPWMHYTQLLDQILQVKPCVDKYSIP